MRSVRKAPIFGNRLRLAGIFVCLILSLLLLRIWYLQGIKGSYFRDLSENNRTRTVRTLAPRGNVYDRDGRILVQNRPAFDVSLMLEDTPNIEQSLKMLAGITSKELDALQGVLDARGRRRKPFEPQVVMADVSREELAEVKVRTHMLPGVMVDVTPTRAYPNHEQAAHVLGYVREVNKKQLVSLRNKHAEKNYHAGDIVGQSGLERQWEPFLQGDAGFRQVEVDAKGKRRGELGIVDNMPGNDLHLTIDLDLQKAAQEALGEFSGSVVALDPHSGEVLALVSSPTFDANLLAGRTRPEDWNALINNKEDPLTNRAIAENYAPASTFKLIVALAGLAEKKISPHTKLDCPGFYYFAGRKYRCHKRSGHGKVDMKDAVKMSCDSYFYQLGRKLGISLIHKYASMFGFGKKTGIDLPGERRGVAPSNEWKLKYLGERWYPGETLSVSIGQGFLTTTPMQVAVATAALANGGKIVKPFVVKNIKTREGDFIYTARPEIKDLKLNQRQLKLVKKFASAVVNEKKGTGGRAKLEGIEVGGKTGTAQVVALGKETLRKKFRDHAWFVSFAPVDDPQIAIAIIAENAGHGGTSAAPVSKKVMEVFFRKKGMLPPEEEETAEDAAENLQARESRPTVREVG